MFKKYFIIIITTLIIVISKSPKIKNLVNDIVEEENQEVTSIENAVNNTTPIIEVKNPSIITENKKNTEDLEAKNNKDETIIVGKQKEQQIIISNDKSNVEVKKEIIDTQENKEITKTENETVIIDESNKTQPKEEPTKTEDITKETIEYNEVESLRMVNDIKEIVKRNKYLWDENGNPLFKVEIDKAAMNGEYMYPYSKQRLEGKVLNVFPVKFLVYVVDIQRPGFQKEQKYYISIVNL